MKNNYLIEYNDDYSYNIKLKEIIKNANFVDAPINNYDIEEEQLQQAIEDIDTYSLFSSNKVIIIKNINLLDIDSNDGKHLLKYLDNPNNDNLLILVTKKLDSRKKNSTILKKKTTYIKVESSPSEIIKKELKDYIFEIGAKDLLIEYTNNEIDAIKSECDKLKLYKENDKKITKKDIKDICYKHLGDTTQLTYDLVKEISSKNKKKSLQLYIELHKHNIDDIGIIGLLESQLRLLKQISLLLDMRKYESQIATILNIHPFRIKKTIELLRYISRKEIDNLIVKLANFDYKIKSGEIETNKSLEMFLLNL